MFLITSTSLLFLLKTAFHFNVPRTLFQAAVIFLCNIILQYKTVTPHTKGKMMSEVSKANNACAACKFHKKKCSDECVLAPYFPPNDREKFLLVHRLFGYGHVVKLLKGLPAEQRSDAVSSLVYEARARVADPVHGSVAVINDLHKKLEEVESQLASTQAELGNISVRHDNLYTLITGSAEGWDTNFYSASAQESQDTQYTTPPVLDDDIACTLQLSGDPYLDFGFGTSQTDDSAAYP